MKEGYNDDHCYECKCYGDGYIFDENSDLIIACDDCPFNEQGEEQTEEC